MRAPPVLVLLVLLLGSFTLAAPSGAGTASPLAVDAGASQVAFDGESLVLQGQARGGAAPYAFAWTGAAAARFSDPASATPAFSTAGLPVGNLTLTLTVTDALGAVATDAVRLRADVTTLALNATGTVTAGVDDESQGTSLDARTHALFVPPRTGLLSAALGWDASQTPTPELDLSARRADGILLPPTQGHAGTNPETFVERDPYAGSWTLIVEPREALNARYALTARLGATPYLPEVFTLGPYSFGTQDAQTLGPLARGTVGPYAFEWDLDGDGWFETVGKDVTGSLPVGVHHATVRATDAEGFSNEATTEITVEESDHVLPLLCGGNDLFPYWAMEYTASRGTCWIHGGHHTYYMRGTYAFRGAWGVAFAVEQEFAPSTSALNASHPLHAPVDMEVSLDGLSWTHVGTALYEYGLQRQHVWFDLEGQGEPFRFVRIHAPLSATEGLSGYLDHSHLLIEADALLTSVGTSGATSKTLDCATHVMEDFFDAHPCTFGGVDRYDAPSFFHTYVAGASAELTAVNGSFTLAPWRTDDFFSGTPLLSANATKAYVQVSGDGIHWTDVATVNATFGVAQPFRVELPGTSATFVRLLPEYHANFDRWQTLAPHHHPRGYFLDSRVTLEGAFVEWS